MSKSIEEAFARFRHDMIALTGDESPIVKIALTPRAYEYVLYDLNKKAGYRMGIFDLSEMKLMGIQLVVRTHDTF